MLFGIVLFYIFVFGKEKGKVLFMFFFVFFGGKWLFNFKDDKYII